MEKKKTNFAWKRKNKYCMEKKKQILHGIEKKTTTQNQ